MNNKEISFLTFIMILATITKRIPTKHGAFNDFQKNLVIKVNLYSAGWSLSQQAINEWNLLTVGPASKKTIWDAKWLICSAKDAKPSQTAAMKTAFNNYKSGKINDPNDVSIQLWLSRYIRKNPLVSDEQKVEMGLLIPDTKKTSSTPKNAFLENELNGILKRMKHLQHTTEWFFGITKTKVLPPGCASIDIFTCITESTVKEAPPIKDFKYSGHTTAGEFDLDHDISDECKKCWYFAKAKSKGRNGKYGTPSPIFYIAIA